MPNPWDVGSTRYLQGLGFKALATTSAGFAWSRGFGDGGVPRDMMLAHIAELSAAADVPMNADFEGGYADAPEGVAESVRLCVATGVSGLSIEDYTGNKDDPLYEFDLAVARVKAARAAIDKAGGDVRADRAQRGPDPQPARSRRGDPPAQGLFGGRCRLPLCAGHHHARADQGGGGGAWRRSRSTC